MIVRLIDNLVAKIPGIEKITKRQTLYLRLGLLAGAIITCFSACIIVNLILSRFEGNCVLYSKLVENSNDGTTFLISEFGPRSNCGYIIVVSEIILISAPFLLILLAIEFHTDPTERIAALCRKCNALWGVIFFILVLIQASMSSFGLNNRLCGAIKKELSNGKCDQKLKFYHGPPDVCNSEDSCKKTTPKIESFYSTLGALEACSWILFTIMFLYNFANIIGVYQRHEAYVMKDPVTLKTTTTTTTPTTSTTQNGAASKRAPPAPPKSASSPPPADFDSASLDFVTDEFPHRNPPEPMSLAQRDSVDA